MFVMYEILFLMKILPGLKNHKSIFQTVFHEFTKLYLKFYFSKKVFETSLRSIVIARDY